MYRKEKLENLATLHALFKQEISKVTLQFEYKSPKSPSSSTDFPHESVELLWVLVIALSTPLTEGERILNLRVKAQLSSFKRWL